ncbi:MAG TPA: sigma-70 family RNA polymerase sigma factor [Gemmatales bacterium]|nr:sigma-70 family RNA polymerase sigma factor [Gemmatales bacterium]HMP59323.1 sigma-70 family RNA polymerase sigma factor [Gemmatales bacterium]
MGSTSAQYAMRDPDVRLMLRVREGDPEAFAELVDRFQHRLLGILTHLVGRADEAEDLAQEVFLRVYRARADYHPQAKFSTWFFTIANNVALNALRQRQRKPLMQLPPAVTRSGSLDGGVENQVTADGRTEAPDRRLHHDELAHMVQEALAQLNERQRLAVVLNKFEDMSYDEISQVMGISTKAVKSLLSRARCQLRELLKDYVLSRSGPLPVVEPT